MLDADALAATVGRLRAAGQRVTPQRVLILGMFAAGEHLTAHEVYARVAQVSPAVNRSTVYRTLERLRDLGLLSETDLGDAERHFELLGDDRHHHLVCRGCGAMLLLGDEFVRPLREAARARYGFVARIDHLALFGLCSRCQDTMPAPADEDDH
jgi:Fur family ferric uptake transcriptional regulator